MLQRQGVEAAPPAPENEFAPGEQPEVEVIAEPSGRDYPPKYGHDQVRGAFGQAVSSVNHLVGRERMNYLVAQIKSYAFTHPGIRPKPVGQTYRGAVPSMRRLLLSLPCINNPLPNAQMSRWELMKPHLAEHLQCSTARAPRPRQDRGRQVRCFLQKCS